MGVPFCFLPPHNPFCVSNAERVCCFYKNNFRSSASRFFQRRGSRRWKRAPTIAYVLTQKIVNFTRLVIIEYILHKSAPSVKSARENANRLQEF